MKKISRANRILFITAAVFFLVQVILSLGTAFFGWSLPVPAAVLISPVLVMGPALIYALIKRRSFSEMFRMKKTKWINLLMAVLVLICSYPVIAILNLISMFFVENAVADTMTEMLSQTNFVYSLLTIAVMPAFAEELLFRGAVYHTYRPSRPVAGLLFSAAAFGLMHGNFNQMPYAMFLGVVLALMVEATDSIWIGMWMHFLLNGFSVTMMYLMPADVVESSADSAEMVLELFQSLINSGGTMMMVMTICVYILIAIFFAAAVFALILAVFRMNHRSLKFCFRRQFGKTEKKDRIVDGWFVGFFAIILLQYVLMLFL